VFAKKPIAGRAHCHSVTPTINALIGNNSQNIVLWSSGTSLDALGCWCVEQSARTAVNVRGQVITGGTSCIDLSSLR
jgi:hypothetical protein